MSFTYQKIAILDDSGNKTGDKTDCIKRKEDQAQIPFDNDNTDYQEYLAWVAAGNTPDASP
tara:strand:- start:178 stop:360 length:183 start_codon:yes stop_codon:yes gene_type:complete